MHHPVLIIGAGLTGLSLAWRLKKHNIPTTIIEARNRTGGRIHTLYPEGQPPQEMGATWLGQKHTALVSLLQELGLNTFEQQLGERAIYEPISTSPPQLVQLPPNNDPSYRIAGGSSQLIKALAERLDDDQILPGQAVKSIIQKGTVLEVASTAGTYTANYVISTLPPYLFVNTITVEPELPKELLGIAQQTHTWMGDSIKVSLAYAEPFWRADHLSGTIFSNVGPIPEMYDHSNVEDTAYALKGFLNSAYYSLTKAERREMVLQQLEKYFGSKARKFLTYQETVWRQEPYTFTDYDSHVLPHQHGGHPAYQQTYLDGRLYLAGSETATAFPGYMDGAVRSAEMVAMELKSIYAGAD